MERREIIAVIGLAPFILLTACERSLPGNTTTVQGIVVDENNSPIAGVPFSFYGYKNKGLSAFTTFDETKESDADGKYTFTHIIPGGTDNVFLVSEENAKFKWGQNYDLYMIKDGVDMKFQHILVPFKEYGKIKTVNFKVKKI